MADPIPVLDLAQRLRQSVGALVRPVRSTDQLPLIPATVLGLLDREGPRTIADLAALRQVRHQTMSETVRELLQQDWVATHPDPKDGRKKLVTITASGRAAVQSDRDRRAAVLAEAIDAALTDEQQRQLWDALDLVDLAADAVRTQVDGTEWRDEPLTGDV